MKLLVINKLLKLSNKQNNLDSQKNAWNGSLVDKIFIKSKTDIREYTDSLQYGKNKTSELEINNKIIQIATRGSLRCVLALPFFYLELLLHYF